MAFKPKSRNEHAMAMFKTMLLNPEATANFVCIVAEEVSLSELERICVRFHISLKNIDKKANLEN